MTQKWPAGAGQPPRANALPIDHGLEAVIDWLKLECTIEGCELRTTRRGQPCNLCSNELGVGG